MWKNYLVTTYRNLVRNKLYAAINILGLTVGITCFSIIVLYVENELSFDKFQTNQSYRFLVTEQTGNGEERTFGIVGAKTLDEIAEKVVGIEAIFFYVIGVLVRCFLNTRTRVSKRDQSCRLSQTSLNT